MTFSDFFFEGRGQGCTYILTKKLFIRAQHFCINRRDLADALHYHDWLIYLLARCYEMGWIFDENPNRRYRQHLSNEIGARGGAASVLRRLNLIRDCWYRSQVAAAINIYLKESRLSILCSDFVRLFLQPDSPIRRIRLAGHALKSERRRSIDHCVVAAAFFGWVDIASRLGDRRRVSEPLEFCTYGADRWARTHLFIALRSTGL